MRDSSISQQDFLKVKERLDYYRFDTTFPFEATHLLKKILNRLDQHERKHGNTYGEGHSSKENSHNSLDLALKHEMAKIIKENNQLHVDLMSANEQIQSLNHSIDKIKLNKNSGVSELDSLLKIKCDRERELFEELTQVRYRYNELMDFLHEDPNQEKEYIKRLLKHKHIPNSTGESHNVRQSREKHQKGGQSQVQQLRHRVSYLQSKVYNRQNEILRLQKLVEYDGINMNKVLKDFNSDLIKSKLNTADEQIQYLRNQNQKLKIQNKGMKDHGGLKEALRKELEKCQIQIKNLNQQNKYLKRLEKEKKFDEAKNQRQVQRKVRKTHSQIQRVSKQKRSGDSTIDGLNKKVHFLSKQHQKELKQKESLRQQIAKKEEILTLLQKQNEEKRLYYEYEIQSHKKKILQANEDLSILKQKYKSSLDEVNLLKKQDNLKNQAIQNLEKIVDELMRKNSIISETAGGDSSLRQNESIQAKRQIIQTRQLLIQAQNQRDHAEFAIKNIESRLHAVIKENQDVKHQNKILSNLVNGKEDIIRKLTYQIDDLKQLFKKQQHQSVRMNQKVTELNALSEKYLFQWRLFEQKSMANEKMLKQKIRDLQISLSQQEQVVSIKNMRLQEREAKIKYFEVSFVDLQEKYKYLSQQNLMLDERNRDLAKDKHRLLKKYEDLSQEGDNNKIELLRENQQLKLRVEELIAIERKLISELQGKRNSLRNV